MLSVRGVPFETSIGNRFLHASGARSRGAKGQISSSARTDLGYRVRFKLHLVESSVFEFL